MSCKRGLGQMLRRNMCMLECETKATAYAQCTHHPITALQLPVLTAQGPVHVLPGPGRRSGTVQADGTTLVLHCVLPQLQPLRGLGPCCRTGPSCVSRAREGHAAVDLTQCLHTRVCGCLPEALPTRAAGSPRVQLLREVPEESVDADGPAWVIGLQAQPGQGPQPPGSVHLAQTGGSASLHPHGRAGSSHCCSVRQRQGKVSIASWFI